MSERISKVSYNKGIVAIETAHRVPGVSEKTAKATFYEEPHKDFVSKLDALAPFVREILELPPEIWDGRIKITGVSYSWSEAAEVGGAVITFQVHLDGSNAPFCGNTPHLPYDQYSEGAEQPVMPEEAVDALNEFQAEAYAYLHKGKRAQIQEDLFSGKDAAAGERVEEAVS